MPNLDSDCDPSEYAKSFSPKAGPGQRGEAGLDRDDVDRLIVSGPTAKEVYSKAKTEGVEIPFVELVTDPEPARKALRLFFNGDISLFVSEPIIRRSLFFRMWLLGPGLQQSLKQRRWLRARRNDGLRTLVARLLSVPLIPQLL